jgi:hypothetical protein
MTKALVRQDQGLFFRGGSAPRSERAPARAIVNICALFGLKL